MFNFCFDDMKWIKPHPRDIAPPVWLFVSRCTEYYAYIQVKISRNDSAPITLLLSMVCFINFNILLSLFFSCSVGDLTQVQIKATLVSISVCACLVLHKSFAIMEWKSSSWFFGSVGESGLTLCRFYFL